MWGEGNSDKNGDGECVMAEMKQNGGALHRKEMPALENATRKTHILRRRRKNI